MLEDPKEGKVIKEMEGGETKSTLSLKSWDSWQKRIPKSMKARKQPVVVLALLKPYLRSLRRQDEGKWLLHKKTTRGCSSTP